MRYRRSGGGGMFFLLLYLVFGLYFINSGIGYITLPESISIIDKWINFIGGVLIILGGINFLRISRYNRVY